MPLLELSTGGGMFLMSQKLAAWSDLNGHFGSWELVGIVHLNLATHCTVKIMYSVVFRAGIENIRIIRMLGIIV